MSEQLSTSDVAPADEAVVTEVPVGEQLRRARETRGLSLDDIAQTLKLGQRQVRALESGEWASLPGQTFVRGFVRNYARLVHLDAAPLMVQLDRILERPASNLEVPESRPAAIEPGVFATSSARKDRQVVLGGIGVLVIAAAVYLLMPNDLSSLRDKAQGMLDALGRKEAPAEPAPEPVFPPGSTPQQVMNPQVLTPAEPSEPAPAKAPETAMPAAPATQAAPAAPAAAAVSAPAPAPSPAAPAPGAAQLRFVAEKAAWVEVRDRDNKVVFSQRLGAGSEQMLAGAGPLAIVVGYAPGVRLFWHGQAVDLAPHTKGDVARLVLE